MQRSPLMAAALVLLLDTTARCQSIVYTAQGGWEGGPRLSWWLSGTGDLDRDGFEDVAVGTPTWASSAGRLRVHSGRDASVLFRRNGEHSYEEFGSFVSTTGDVNQDGTQDVIVGGTGLDLDGMAMVLSGLNGETIFFYRGQNRELLGSSVDGTGDLNLDGWADFVMGSPGYNVSGSYSHEGRVQVFSGRDGSVLHELVGDASDEYFGWSVCGLLDVNGDGVGEFCVGEPRDASEGSDNGKVHVYSGVNASELHHVSGNPGDWFGWSISAAGDVDGDGVADLLAGAPSVGGGQTPYVRILSGVNGEELGFLQGSSISLFGVDVDGGKDVDGDQVPDIMVGAAYAGADELGAAYVYSGKTLAPLLVVDGDAGAYFAIGQAVALADVTGDGKAEAVIGGNDLMTSLGRALIASAEAPVGSWSRYGSGWPGTLGVPDLSSAPPYLCTEVPLLIENSSAWFAAAAVFGGVNEASLPTAWGGTLLVLPTIVVPVMLPPQGAALPVAIPCDVTALGATVHFQVLQLDPGASHGVSFTPAVKLVFGGEPLR